jgi:hypothetical protein
MEATAIQLYVKKELINLISVHNPPGKILDRDLELLIGTGHEVIFADDFNAKHVTWGVRQDDAAGQIFLNITAK